MNTPLSTSSGSNAPNTTTTEELIVQYLDGELVRKELETVLFDRLASSEEARTLLREYLVVRGAIRQSHKDERFQLSSDLDKRTRGRIEQLFETIAVEGFDVAFPVSASVPEHFLGDKPALASSAASRRIKQSVTRASLAMLALLLAVGTTWFVTRTSDERSVSRQIAEQVPAAAELHVPMIAASTAPAAPVDKAVPTRMPRELNRERHSPATPVAIVPSLAETHASHAIQQKTVAPAQANPNDIMMSDRFGKAIEAAGKHEVVISHQDRL